MRSQSTRNAFIWSLTLNLDLRNLKEFLASITILLIVFLFSKKNTYILSSQTCGKLYRKEVNYTEKNEEEKIYIRLFKISAIEEADLPWMKVSWSPCMLCTTTSPSHTSPNP